MDATTTLAGRAGPMPTTAVLIPEPLTSVLLDRLQCLLNVLQETGTDLSMLNERTFGPSPAELAAGKASPPTAAGRAEELHAVIDRCQTAAQQSCQLARGLNSRI